MCTGEFALDSEAWKAFNIFALVYKGRESCKHMVSILTFECLLFYVFALCVTCHVG